MLNISLNYPDDPKYWESIFERAVLRPESWIEAAREITVALNVLRTPAIDFMKAASGMAHAGGAERNLPIQKRVHGTYMMLGAYAIENVFKAIIASNVKIPGTSPQALLSQVRSHDLLALASKAGLQFEDRGRELLRRMAHYAVWAGRYPAPLKIVQLKPHRIDAEEMRSLDVYRGTDIRGIDEVLNGGAEALNVPPIVLRDIRGYGDEREDWETIVMQIRVTAWQPPEAPSSINSQRS